MKINELMSKWSLIIDYHISIGRYRNWIEKNVDFRLIRILLYAPFLSKYITTHSINDQFYHLNFNYCLLEKNMRTCGRININLLTLSFEEVRQAGENKQFHFAETERMNYCSKIILIVIIAMPLNTILRTG